MARGWLERKPQSSSTAMTGWIMGGHGQLYPWFPAHGASPARNNTVLRRKRQQRKPAGRGRLVAQSQTTVQTAEQSRT
jgi:hypothetical protein